MFKIIILVKRKPGLTREQFRADFENYHIPLVSKFAAMGEVPPMIEYRRNYLLEGQPHNTMEPEEFGFDAIIEAVYESREHFQRTRDLPKTNPQLAQELTEDFERLLAPGGLRYLVVEEHSGGSGAPVSHRPSMSA